MNIDPGMAAGYVLVAVGGLAVGALVGRWMMTEMGNAMSAETRLSSLEQMVIGHFTPPARRPWPVPTNSAAPGPGGEAGRRSAAPHRRPRQRRRTGRAGGVGAGHRPRASCERGRKAGGGIDKHAQAVDDHGAATVAAAVEAAAHPALVFAGGHVRDAVARGRRGDGRQRRTGGGGRRGGRASELSRHARRTAS